MTDDTDRETREKVSLVDCPIGLFMHGGELCMKTEYGSNEGRIDAYIVSSGEFFWGLPPQTIARQRCQLVTPVDAQELLAAWTATRLPAAGLRVTEEAVEAAQRARAEAGK